MSNITLTETCKNCGHSINTYNYCPDCGAKKITDRITFSHLINEFTNRFLNVDNSFIRTFKHLFTQPESVIDGYIQGLRKRYINAFGYFAISITVSGFYALLTKNRVIETLKQTSPDVPAEVANMQMQYLEYVYKYQSLISFAMIPMLALMSRLVFLKNKKYNYTEHLVIYLYAFSHIVTITSLVILPITFYLENQLLTSFIPIFAYIVYNAYVLKRLFELSFMQLIGKTLLFLLILSFVFVVFVIILIFCMIVFGDFPPVQT